MKREIIDIIKLILLLIVVITIMVMLTSIATSLSVKVLNPSSTHEVDSNSYFEYYSYLENPNPYPVNITIGNPKEFDLNMWIDTYEFQPNEKKLVNFTISTRDLQNGTYYIPITYEGNGESFSVSQSITFKVNQVKDYSKYLIYLTIIIFITTVILFFKRMKGGRI